MPIWTHNADGSYSAVFPIAGGRRYEITVSEDEFADEEFEKGKGQFLPLKEGHFYHYEISGGGKLAAVSSFAKGCGKSGRLAPGTAVGYGRLWLEGHTDPSEALDVEVVSEVIGYKDDYQKLLTQLTGYVADLQMQCTSDVQYLVGEDYERDPALDLQRFFFLVGLVNDATFDQALRRIVESPYTKLRTLETECDIRHATRFSAAMLRELASAPRRIAAPESLRNLGIETLPERIAGSVREETTDIAENRFVKHVLTVFRGGLQEFKDKIADGKLKAKSDKLYAVELDVNAALDRLDGWLSGEFFRGIGQLTAMPSSSIVLQRREGYRDLLRKWLQSHAASKMAWEAMEDAHRENQKDVATLYEYWCFFRLLDIIKDMFNIEDANIQKSLVVEIGSDGLSLKLNEGKQLNPPLSGSYASPHTSHRYRKLDIEFQYNRRFGKSGKGSWTMQMIPDYTISFRPKDMPIPLAEKLDLITYVHFDAKYKAKDIVEKLETAADEHDSESCNAAIDNEEAKAERDAKRVDILKMHTYRDAIPRTAGAYILFPGTKEKDYRYGDEILPGLGAFPLYPKDDMSEEEEPLRRFLASVAEYLCDRITRWENFTYQKNLVFSGTQEEWGKHQAEVAHRFKMVNGMDDAIGDYRVNMSDRDRLMSIPPDRFMYTNIGDAPKETRGRWFQAKWISDHHQFVMSTGRYHDEKQGAPEDKLMIVALWMPPFSMMVTRYCGIRTREQLEATGEELPFSGHEFHVWDISLHNFDHVAAYLTKHPFGPDSDIADCDTMLAYLKDQYGGNWAWEE